MWPFTNKEQRGSVENPEVPLSAPNVLQALGWDTSGVHVTPDKALQVPAVWSAVNFLSGTIASLPLHVYRRGDEGRERASDNDPLQRLLHDAINPEWTSYGWRKYGMSRALLSGRWLTFIERNRAGRPMSLWPLNPQNVTVVSEDSERGPTTKYRYNGVEYNSDEIIDIPFMLGPDQVEHVDPTARLKSSIGLAIALQEYAENYFNNGGVPPLVLQGPLNSPAGVKRASQDLDQAVKEASREGSSVLPIPSGHELKPLGFNPEQSQLVEARRFQLEEIARIYDIPPVFLQDLTNGTYSNAEQQGLHFVKHTLTQWLTCIEQEINLKLFRTSRNFVEFSVDGLLRGDFKTRMEGYAQAVQNAIKTPNEVRQHENDPPMPGGDQIYLQQNMSDLDRLDQEDGDSNE